MFSITLKRSVATFGVVAGLLAAAVPASAQGGGADSTKFVVDARGTQASSEVFELNTFGGNDTLTIDSGPGDDNIRASPTRS